MDEITKERTKTYAYGVKTSALIILLTNQNALRNAIIAARGSAVASKNVTQDDITEVVEIIADELDRRLPIIIW